MTNKARAGSAKSRISFPRPTVLAAAADSQAAVRPPGPRFIEPALFRHSTICWPLVRRRTADLLLYTAAAGIELLATRGYSLLWPAPDHRHDEYRAAQARLRRQGWLGVRQPGGRDPLLYPAGNATRTRLPAALHPERRWNRRWRGTWWLLTYDVPESNRNYRRSLRKFVRQLGMGCLQKSLYISPDDPRAAFQDLEDAAGVSEYAFLFEARTVRGERGADVARAAWSWSELERRQSDFTRTAGALQAGVEAGRYDGAALRALREEAFAVYLEVMSRDPLLPHALWPPLYAGESAYRAHNDLQRAILRRL